MRQVIAIIWKHLAVLLAVVMLNVIDECRLLTRKQFKIIAASLIVWAVFRFLKLLAPILLARFRFFRKRWS